MHLLTAAYLDELKRVHRRHDQDHDFFSLARRMQVRVQPGPTSTYFPGPPPTVFIDFGLYSARYAQRIGMHELAHHVLIESGIERDLMRFHGDWPGLEETAELFAQLGAAHLLIPDRRLFEVRRAYGDNAEALLHLYSTSQAPLHMVLQRAVHGDEHASRAAWVTNDREIVRFIAAQNIYLPFWRYDRQPAITDLPDESAVTYVPLPWGGAISAAWAG